jgi:hypothetical protein
LHFGYISIKQANLLVHIMQSDSVFHDIFPALLQLIQQDLESDFLCLLELDFGRRHRFYHPRLRRTDHHGYTQLMLNLITCDLLDCPLGDSALFGWLPGLEGVSKVADAFVVLFLWFWLFFVFKIRIRIYAHRVSTWYSTGNSRCWLARRCRCCRQWHLHRQWCHHLLLAGISQPKLLQGLQILLPAAMVVQIDVFHEVIL